jgi:hypothetical protein
VGLRAQVELAGRRRARELDDDVDHFAPTLSPWKLKPSWMEAGRPS